ncbi:MAG: pilus assembly protein TadG-related protein [Demequina sp.]|uniref:pilus assembly protein TadG-related protein n=1 Tax=Demequina sp. TaxID=2050685 RepID=UPI003A881AB9
MRARDDEGSISVLTLGWIVVVAIAFLVVAAATQVHVDRLRLVALADELALDAADSVDGDTYYATGSGSLVLDADRVRDQVEARLADDPARPWVSEVTLIEADAPDGQSASVVLGRTVPLPWNLDVLAPWADGVAITASATARSS